MTEAGVNLKAVRRILDLEEELAGLRTELERARAERAEAGAAGRAAS